MFFFTTLLMTISIIFKVKKNRFLRTRNVFFFFLQHSFDNINYIQSQEKSIPSDMKCFFFFYNPLLTISIIFKVKKNRFLQTRFIFFFLQPSFDNINYIQSQEKSIPSDKNFFFFFYNPSYDNNSDYIQSQEKSIPSGKDFFFFFFFFYNPLIINSSPSTSPGWWSAGRGWLQEACVRPQESGGGGGAAARHLLWPGPRARATGPHPAADSHAGDEGRQAPRLLQRQGEHAIFL